MNSKITLGLIALLGILIWVLQHDAFERGIAQGQSKIGAAVVERFTDTVKVRDTLYRRDSIITTKVLTEYATTHDTVTVIRHDTAVIYVEKAVADSAVNACTSLLHSCDIRVALRDSLISGLRFQLANVPKPPGFLARWAQRTLYAGAGYGFCAATRR